MNDSEHTIVNNEDPAYNNHGSVTVSGGQHDYEWNSLSTTDRIRLSTTKSKLLTMKTREI